jgi:hypothetical protein
MPKYGTTCFKCHSIDLDDLVTKKLSQGYINRIFAKSSHLNKPRVFDGKFFLNDVEIPDEILFGEKVPSNNILSDSGNHFLRIDMSTGVIILFENERITIARANYRGKSAVHNITGNKMISYNDKFEDINMYNTTLTKNSDKSITLIVRDTVTYRILDERGFDQNLIIDLKGFNLMVKEETRMQLTQEPQHQPQQQVQESHQTNDVPEDAINAFAT